MKYKLSPSKAERFLQCTKSLEFDTEFVETPVTIRGSLLHDIARKMLLEEEWESDIKTYGINDYELYLLTSYVDGVWQEYEKINAREIYVEEKMTVNLYGNAINLIMDSLLVSEDTASIIDLKTGSVKVEEKGNKQLLFYGYCAINRFPNVKKIRMSIGQKGKIRTVEKDVSEILNFFLEKESVFESINRNELTYNPSDTACKYCANKLQCVARAEWIIGGKK